MIVIFLKMHFPNSIISVNEKQGKQKQSMWLKMEAKTIINIQMQSAWVTIVTFGPMTSWAF